MSTVPDIAKDASTVPAFRVARSTRVHRFVLVVSVAIVVALASVPWWAEVSVARTMVTFFTLLALAQMWNLLAGYAGLVSIGQQAYIGLGAYGLWLIGDVLGLHPFIAVFAAGLLALAVALPVAPLIFRLRGGYFSIGTWVIAEIVRLVVSNIQATGGGSGKTVLSAARLPIDTRITGTYLLALFVAVGSILLVYFLLRSRTGLALTAIRDNDIAAQSSGVNVFRSKLFVWAVAAFVCGVIGAVVALNLLRIQPAAAFSINWTAYALFIVVIGGFGTIEGPLIGAVIYFALLQSLSQYGTLYMLLLGIVAVIMATVAPKGIWGFVEKRWNVRLFPVSRRLLIEAPPPDEEPEPAEETDVSVATSV
ncbi:MAG: branched-chain amino acid ABC transporter permease [Actinobacteria bacterium]|nr:branched-chain amino acid ABC transporter permease [Actinomycetota bacterium]